MPESRSPGVHIEEISGSAKPIEGVSTSTAGFAGPARSGPIDQAVGPITSFAAFERQFGDGAALAEAPSMPNFLWHGARAFFLEGGRRLWVARVGRERARPDPAAYERGLAALEGVDEISIVAAPGASFGGAGDFAPDALATSALLVAQAERRRNRIAVLDAPDGQGAAQVRGWRKHFDSSYAALYYPWIEVVDPTSERRLLLPPSGAIAGIYARTDIERGVHKAPANVAVRAATGLEAAIAGRELQALSAAGIDCLRPVAGRGVLVWSARTLSADSEWKYVNVRRLFIYLERSIDKGTQWVVFEPNGEALWANVRDAVQGFLYAAWRNGALIGARPEDAFFVRCDRTTMTQDDLDNGRLVCLVGVAPVRPAEFVIFRIEQSTADARP
jgi:phage tail sheath protein FI